MIPMSKVLDCAGFDIYVTILKLFPVLSATAYYNCKTTHIYTLRNWNLANSEKKVELPPPPNPLIAV